MGELKSAEEHSKKAMADAAKLAEELRHEQEHSAQIEKLRRGLETQLKELQARQFVVFNHQLIVCMTSYVSVICFGN